MHTHQIQHSRGRLVVLPLLAIGASLAAFFLAESETAIFFAVLLAPALVVFSIHLLCLGVWQRFTCWRLRRHIGAALTRGDAGSLRLAAARTAEADRDWPGHGLRELGKALEIMRRRVERP